VKIKIKNNSNAFTLVELLVVISIIALLLGILLPSLSTARQQAKGVVCLSKLKQMALAANAYTADYKGHFPIGYYKEFSGAIKTDYVWDFITTSTFSSKKYSPGILWSHTDSMAIQQCPSFKGSSNAGREPYTGYNYNISYIGRGTGFSVAQSAKITDVKRPGQTALFGDGQYEAGANKFMRSPFASPYDKNFAERYAGTQGFRHKKQTNVAFCDGHAEALSKQYSNTYKEYIRNVADGTGFLSNDNSLYDLE
jgi:prepilin-type processing-associated H-X9-DG protein/prepilin-type N-terminal cleavage/methylation domain-containing protein